MPTYDPGSPDLSFDATALRVVRYVRGAETFEAVAWVRPLGAQWFEGAKPPAARLEYVFDDHDPDSPNPTQFERVWPLTATMSQAIRQDDELLIYRQAPDGSWGILFDGFAQIPQVDVSPRAQSVTFTAVATPIRCSDDPIGGAFYRQGYQPLSGDEVATDLTSRFNSDRHGNATASGYDVNQGSTDPANPPYPLFLDWQLDTTSKRLWTLGMFARYILAKYNNQRYVDNPDFGDLDELLENRAAAGGGFIDPSDPTTYTSSPIIIRDVVADGRLWPDQLESVLRYHGFIFRWVLSGDPVDDDSGNITPRWTLDVYRLDTGISPTPKIVTLPPTGASVDTDYVNLGGLSVVRDHNAVFNAVRIDTDPTLYEVDLLLSPLFQFATTDYDDANAHTWDKANLDPEDEGFRAKYRWFGVDEAAEGHTNYDTGAWDTTDAFSFDPILGKPDANGVPQWVVRRRPARHTLNSLDTDAHPLETTLWLSTDWTPPTGAVPGPWDGSSGTWQQTTAFRLLKDRLGVELTCDSPLSWPAGKGPVSGAPTINIVGAQNGITPHQEFLLCLSTVIEGDQGISASVLKRLAAPGKYTVTRRLDARDHFRKETVCANTEYNPDTSPIDIRDDTLAALAHAGAVQTAHEFPHTAGTITIPYLTFAYLIGDRISKIAGREVSLRTNAGDASEAPRYPTVVAVAWEFGTGGQKTVLQLDDRRAEVQAITRSATLDA